MTPAANPSPTQAPAPDLSIRVRPPSPRRLSRKVLLAGALSAGGVIALALFFGLSERPDRRQADAVASAGGPPDSIANAASQYEADDLPQLEAPRDTSRGELAPSEPADLSSSQEGAWRGGAAAPSAAAGPRAA